MAPKSDAPKPDSRTLSRRRFLRAGIAGGVALGVGGVLAWQTSGYEVPAAIASKLEALSPKEYLIVEALARRVLRGDGPGYPTADEVSAARFVDGLVARLDGETRLDLKRLLHLLEHGLPLRAGKLGRFTRLSGEAQDAVLARMEQSEIGILRGAFESLKSLCLMAYFRDARTWGAIGYDGPLVGRPREGWVPLRARGAR